MTWIKNIDEIWQLNHISVVNGVHWVYRQNIPNVLTDGMGVPANQWNLICKWHIKRKNLWQKIKFKIINKFNQLMN